MKKLLALFMVLALGCGCALAETADTTGTEETTEPESRTSTITIEGVEEEITEYKAELGGYEFWYDSELFAIDSRSNEHISLLPVMQGTDAGQIIFVLTGDTAENVVAVLREQFEDAEGWTMEDPGVDAGYITEDGQGYIMVRASNDSEYEYDMVLDDVLFQITGPVGESEEGMAQRMIAIAMTLTRTDAAVAGSTGETWDGVRISGAVIKEADVISDEESAYGYVQTLSVDQGLATVVTGRFDTTHELEAYLDGNYTPADDNLETLDDITEIDGCSATHMRYTTEGEDGACVVDAFRISDGEDILLFMSIIDEDTYTGKTDGDAYEDFVPQWVAGLSIS